MESQYILWAYYALGFITIIYLLNHTTKMISSFVDYKYVVLSFIIGGFSVYGISYSFDKFLSFMHYDDLWFSMSIMGILNNFSVLLILTIFASIFASIKNDPAKMLMSAVSIVLGFTLIYCILEVYPSMTNKFNYLNVMVITGVIALKSYIVPVMFCYYLAESSNEHMNFNKKFKVFIVLFVLGVFAANLSYTGIFLLLIVGLFLKYFKYISFLSKKNDDFSVLFNDTTKTNENIKCLNCGETSIKTKFRLMPKDVYYCYNCKKLVFPKKSLISFLKSRIPFSKLYIQTLTGGYNPAEFLMSKATLNKFKETISIEHSAEGNTYYTSTNEDIINLFDFYKKVIIIKCRSGFLHKIVFEKSSDMKIEDINLSKDLIFDGTKDFLWIYAIPLGILLGGAFVIGFSYLIS